MRRSNKKGFTLTEVLLAMALVGIMSVLVVPQLVKTIQKDKSGMLLGKAVEQIELGCQNMIQEYNESMENQGRTSMADTLMAMDGDYAFSMESLSRYIGAKNSLVIPNIPGKHVALPQFSRYKFEKFPAEIYVQPRRPLVVEGRDEFVFTSFIIDVNGLDQRPNGAGKDRFSFQLRNDGKLVPEGLGVNTCDGDSPARVDANCTARVVKDGFKINYNW